MAIVRLPVVSSVTGSIESDGRRKRIVPADVHGRFDRARKIVFALLIALWVALPWVRVGNAPAVFLDVEARRFYLFGATLNAQDGGLLFFLVSGVGFGLLFLTAVAGRVWCGWSCPQTVFLEGVYRRVERWIEGPRGERQRRDAGAPTLGRAVRKVVKHAAFVIISLVIAHVVLAYFVSLPRAFAMVRLAPSAHLEAFAWVTAIASLLYGNFAFFKEQLCLVVCPYGRMQSALLDEHSLVVGYDLKRGEPRGKKGTTGAGDCVDCDRCVTVCPTGIDIRDGLQMDCIACTACIDACDDVMDRLERPRGLIRYDSLAGLAGKPRRVLRPRIALYGVLLAVGAIVAALALHRRTDFEATVRRLPGAPYTVEGGTVKNAFNVHVVSKRGDRSAFVVTVDAPAGVLAQVPIPRVELASLTDAYVTIFVSVPEARFTGDAPLTIRVAREGTADAIVLDAKFLGPGR